MATFSDRYLLADPVYDALRPFHLWAQAAAVCALLLAVAAILVLAHSTRPTRRWWLGMTLLVICLLVVAFGERSRMAARALRDVAAECLVVRPGNCGDWMVWLTDATQRVMWLGIAVLVATALGLGATVLALRPAWPTLLNWLRSPRAWSVHLLTGVAAVGLGAFWLADGVADWIAFAYLNDIRNAGDGLGFLPLYNTIATVVASAIVLVGGLLLVLIGSPRRRVA